MAHIKTVSYGEVEARGDQYSNLHNSRDDFVSKMSQACGHQSHLFVQLVRTVSDHLIDVLRNASRYELPKSYLSAHSKCVTGNLNLMYRHALDGDTNYFPSRPLANFIVHALLSL